MSVIQQNILLWLSSIQEKNMYLPKIPDFVAIVAQLWLPRGLLQKLQTLVLWSRTLCGLLLLAAFSCRCLATSRKWMFEWMIWNQNRNIQWWHFTVVAIYFVHLWLGVIAILKLSACCEGTNSYSSQSDASIHHVLGLVLPLITASNLSCPISPVALTVCSSL